MTPGSRISIVVPVLTALGLAGCGGSTATPATSRATQPSSASNSTAQSGTRQTTSPPAAGPNPNTPEVVAPGDIPDNQAFVSYTAAGGFSVKVPEGWARTDIAADHVTFSDKYNTIDLTWSTTQTAPTESSAKAAVEALGLPGFAFTKASSVQRSSGQAILLSYQRTSDPNAVTGKRVALEVEQYEFWRNGKGATLTLSGAKGADNLDPWKIVTDGFAWAP